MERRANARQMVIVLQMQCAVKVIIAKGDQQQQQVVNAEEMEGRANARKMVHASIKANAVLVLSVRSMA